MKLILAIVLLSLASCAATQFKEAHTRSDGVQAGFGYRIEPVYNEPPFTNYAAFTANKKTPLEKVKAYTNMAALVHCTNQGMHLMIDSKIRNATKEASSDYTSLMVLFGCSNKNSAVKINEKKSIVESFCQAKNTNQGKYCSAKSNYRM